MAVNLKTGQLMQWQVTPGFESLIGLNLLLLLPQPNQPLAGLAH